MSKTIVFKEPFESKLKELKIKTIFAKNYKNWHSTRKFPANVEWKKSLEEADDWHAFIFWGFLWSSTPEGPAFWAHITKM